MAALLKPPICRLLEELMKFWVFANEDTILPQKDCRRLVPRLGF